MFRNHYVGNHAHAQRSPHRNDHKLKKLRKSSAQSSRFSRRIESGFPLRAKRSVEATQFYPKAKGVGEERERERYSFWIVTSHTAPCGDRLIV